MRLVHGGLAYIKRLNVTLHVSVISFLVELALYNDVFLVADKRQVAISPFVFIELLIVELIEVMKHNDMLETMWKVTS